MKRQNKYCWLLHHNMENHIPCSHHVFYQEVFPDNCPPYEVEMRSCTNCEHYEAFDKEQNDEPMTTRESKYDVAIQMEDNVRKMVLLMKKWTTNETDSKVEEYMDAVSNKLSAAYLAFVALNALLAP